MTPSTVERVMTQFPVVLAMTPSPAVPVLIRFTVVPVLTGLVAAVSSCGLMVDQVTTQLSDHLIPIL